MLIQGQHGAPTPTRLVTLQGARIRGMDLILWCDRCQRRARKACVDLPDARRNVSIGELWLMGRFRCAGCGKPPVSLSVIVNEQTTVALEHWGVGEPFVAERLRRHWRHDPYDRRDWGKWFRGWGVSSPSRLRDGEVDASSSRADGGVLGAR